MTPRRQTALFAVGTFPREQGSLQADRLSLIREIVRHPQIWPFVVGGPAAWVKAHVKMDLRVARRHHRVQGGGTRLQSSNPVSVLQSVRPSTCPYFRNEALYAVCRALEPSVLVETGVHVGRSTSLILAALHDNGKGHLHSIDLPNRSYELDDGKAHADLIQRGQASGYAVPTYLRSRWTLHIGDSRHLLPRILAELGEIDVFFHDSEHTYEHMTFEFNEAWPHIRCGGLILSDDVDYNAAFSDFCRSTRAANHIAGSLGMALRE